MVKYLNKEKFLQSMGLLGDETKYGNRDGEHQSRSYGTWMGYEIMDSVEDSTVEEDVVEVVRCKDCKHWIKAENGSWQMIGRTDGACQHLIGTHIAERYMTEGEHFCSYGERREGE